MAPDRPLLTVVLALLVLAGMVLLAVRPSGEDEGRSPEEPPRSAADEEEAPPPAVGDPDGLTVVDPAHVAGAGEAELSYDGAIPASVTYPVIPNAEPLSDFLERELGAEVRAFEAASPGAVSFEAEWSLTAAHGGLVGVRMTRVETDSEGPREGYTTYWYDTATAEHHPSTALIAGQRELERLNDLVRETAVTADGPPGAVDTAVLHPISSLYDSMGFNPAGDLVVEFDAGQVAPASAGRAYAVVDAPTAGELLSDLGARVRDAATVGVERFEIAAPPLADKDGQREGRPPGHLAAVDEGVDCSDPDTRCVALTYDDGPGGRTPELLDVLAEYDARATFFVTGYPVMEHPHTVRRAYAEGHEIANHTLDHPDLARMSPDAVRANLETVQALVYRETGYTMDLMRPPYGSTNETVAEVTADMGLAQILWSVDTNDWRDRKTPVVSSRAVEGASDGAIILMHDIHGTTIDATRSIVSELDARGYTMVTVSQLLGSTTPGEVYTTGTPDTPEGEPEETGENV
ncbi:MULTISPECIES: polysaccharide deacetylase family protein [unclassified Nocardiopsis]|uniref:polysaccharide deacetylase family protein n=1 Tax=unclassified Nocardiopsis TaxID=2649073 RepID=UPI00135BD4DD|nr:MULTISPECIES: polysaccharide deacetylase family protein [unclassified Nocardiopsis]